MTIKQLKKQLGITDKELSVLFDFNNVFNYRSSSAKKRYESALIGFYELVKSTPIKTEINPTTIAKNYGKVIQRYYSSKGWIKERINGNTIKYAESLGELCSRQFKF